MSSWEKPMTKPGPVLTSGRLRKRSFTWCRRPNGFSDNPKWRSVKACTGLELCTVLAFVNRLEEVGNDAANRGDIRGSLVGFKAQDFAAALDISVEEANKLFTALERPDIGWIADGMIVDFHDRNPDVEDPTAADRQRRLRSRNRILRKLGELEGVGSISKEERLEIENRLPRLDHAELLDLQGGLGAKFLQTAVTSDSRMSRRNGVTAPTNQVEAPPGKITDLQNGTCDNVTVTPDQNKLDRSKLATTTLSAASVELGGLPREENEFVPDLNTDPATWLREKAPEPVMNRMGEPYERATARLSGWSEQVHDCAVLADILQGAQNSSGHGFHMEVADQIRRRAH
jgi:hypothetical protein